VYILLSRVLTTALLICRIDLFHKYIYTGVFPADIDSAAQADMILELTQDMNMINPIACFFAADSEVYKEKHCLYFGALLDHLIAAQKILGGMKYFGGIIIDFQFSYIHESNCIYVYIYYHEFLLLKAYFTYHAYSFKYRCYTSLRRFCSLPYP
jgi:hypothetical protein